MAPHVDQLARDATRVNALVLDGFAPMQFTYQQVTAEPGWVVDQTRQALVSPFSPHAAIAVTQTEGRGSP